MLTSVLAAADPSHLPFYLAGSIFAAWAVVLAWIGLSRPAFPFGVVGQRAVMGISFILAVLAVGTSIATA